MDVHSITSDLFSWLPVTRSVYACAKVQECEVEMAFELAATPFRRLKLASFAPLMYESAFPTVLMLTASLIVVFIVLSSSAERAVCPKCKSSRKYFCYTCFIPVGISESSLPTVELPLQVDMCVYVPRVRILHTRIIDMTIMLYSDAYGNSIFPVV